MSDAKIHRTLNAANDAVNDAANDDVTTEELLRFAGPRQAVPEMVRARAKRAARAAWQEKVAVEAARRRSRRRQIFAAVAALALVAFGVMLWGMVGDEAEIVPAEAPRVASVESTWQRLQLLTPGGGALLTPGAELSAGDRIETTEGRAALRLAGGQALRLDAGTRVTLVAADVLELERGAVYLDSAGAVPGAGGVAVRTPYGVARDIGTQFEVRLEEAALEVRVRRGEVEIVTADAFHEVTAGSAIVVDADGGVERTPIDAWGSDWSWVVASTPDFELEGKTLAEVLDRISRETGWTVRYADPDLAVEAASIRVHGGAGALRPDELAAVVVPSAGLDFTLADGTLTIERPR